MRIQQAQDHQSRAPFRRRRAIRGEMKQGARAEEDGGKGEGSRGQM